MNTTTNAAALTTLSIDGMSCGHCVQAVTNALSAVPGVRTKSVTVGTAEIETKDGEAAGQAIAALQEAGYPARATAGEPSAASKMGGGCCGGAGKATAAAKPDVRPTGGCCG